MKVGDLVGLLNTYDNDDKIEIEDYVTATGKFIDTTSAVTISDGDMAFVPTRRIDVEAEKVRDLIH